MFDILVHASNYTTPTRGMHYAAEVARLFDSSLTGLFVCEPIMPIGPIGFSPIVPGMYAAASELINEALQAEPRFRAWATAAGLKRHKWEVATGFFSAAVAAAANWHDVLVLESGRQMPWNSVGMLGHTLVTCGLPCFVVPDEYAKPASFRTVAIASHGSPESVRALHAALPLLKRAERIILVRGGSREAFSVVEFRPAFTIEDHLKQHGLHFSTRVMDVPDDQVGAALLDAAGEAGADVLVMGAYGRARFSEWILGGATRHVLENARLPLFMRH